MIATRVDVLYNKNSNFVVVFFVFFFFFSAFVLKIDIFP